MTEAPSFFGRFKTNGFKPNPTASLEDEFNRLSIHMCWTDKAANRNHAKALDEEINHQYGSSNKLAGWQELCEDVGIKPIPASIRQCKLALSKVYVNIFDLVDSRRTGNLPPRTFGSLSALKKYSWKEQRVYPKAAAKEDGYIKVLLRRLIH